MESQYPVRSLIHVHGVRKLKQPCGEAEEGGREKGREWDLASSRLGQPSQDTWSPWAPISHSDFLSHLYFFSFGQTVQLQGWNSPGVGLTPRQRKHTVLTTGLTGRSLFPIFKHICASCPEAQSYWRPSPLGWLPPSLLPFPGESPLAPKSRE